MEGMGGSGMDHMRVGGLASGFDTQEFINTMMQIERQPIQRMEGEISEVEGKKDVWRDVNKTIKGLADTVSPIRDRDTFTNMNTEAPEGISVTAGSDAEEGNYDIEVHQTAKAHAISSSEPISDIEDFELDLNGEESEDLIIEVGGEELNIELYDGDDIFDIAEAITQQSEGDLESHVERESAEDGRLIIESTETGEDNRITNIESENENILEQIGFEDYDLEAEDYEDRFEEQAAQNADVTIGFTRRDDLQSNEIELSEFRPDQEDVTIDISGADEETSGTIDISRDMDTPVESMQEFVDNYNEIESFLREKGEVQEYGEEVEDEEDIQTGALQGDSMLRNLQNSLRRQLTDPINAGDLNVDVDQYEDINEDTKLSAAYFGLDVGGEASVGDSFNPGELGQIDFDEERFREVLEDKPELVEEFFASEDGVATRLEENIVDEGFAYEGDQDRDKQGTMIGERILSLRGNIDRKEDRIDSMERRIDMREETMWQQFGRMEESLQETFAEGDFLQQELQNM
ncbi:flagellar filament capping protein FliD [Natranaerofaba carboxydovora]|uniref:flagellar filament capping protein FliD n=1 Tax=Natranaerofaba carboxydovora TaxID=2742683 RepID=UPI001F12FBF5|nr:flagellar filament capping protein FliD [Natranaerofaba carboxydovora]UMZ74989.1 Flagellar hook-associated protein 2 [Natranaerofaba carboxydovora]